ncbi:sensor domain-containing diguanylate cyclase [Oceanospirillum sediminis]|uniref:diguanylate cyclase n=1 Tax=Oceanospirillum sediminis TaxID=2760088 RepID=A0A839IRI1_9GAMM|nr:diguanylate cyclase [Oceanospirillum sediminis]MBB1487047.1 diguanylate cyclase [Oceanospirillum sediminis]
MLQFRMDRGLLSSFCYVSLMLIIFASVIVSAGSGSGRPLAFPAAMGETTLTFWYPDSSDPLPLDGEWMGFPDQLLSPAEVEDNLHYSLPVLFPDIWQPPGPRRHMMTYTLLLKKVPQQTELALFVPEIKNSFRLFVNGREVFNGGYASASVDHARGYSGDRIVSLGKLPPETRLVLQVSNYGHARGGVHSPIILATDDEWQSYYQKNILIEGVVICLAILAGILLLTEFLLIPDHKELLWIGLFALVLAGYTGTTGLGSFSTLFGYFPWPLAVRLEYIGFATAIPLFANWLQSLYRQDIKFRIVKYLNWAAASFLIFILLTPSELFTGLLHLLLLFMTFCLLTSVWMMTMLFIRNRAGVRILIFGAFALMTGISHDLSVFLGLWQGDDLLGVGILIFLVSQIGFLTYYRTQEQIRMLDFNRSLQNRVLETEKLAYTRKAELENKMHELEIKKQEYQRLITEDELTGLMNRHCFFEQIGRRIERNRRVSHAIVMIDVDRFKQICDHYGRDLADLVLKKVARQLVQEAEGRFDWIPARYGSDEFIFWLGGVDADQAAQVARRIQTNISRLKMPVSGRGEDAFRFTVSTGVATNAQGQNLDQLLARASDAVHQQRKQSQKKKHPGMGQEVSLSDHLNTTLFHQKGDSV